jgi:hypothetical protein
MISVVLRSTEISVSWWLMCSSPCPNSVSGHRQVALATPVPDSAECDAAGTVTSSGDDRKVRAAVVFLGEPPDRTPVSAQQARQQSGLQY